MAIRNLNLIKTPVSNVNKGELQPEDTFGSAAVKTIKNVPESAWNLASGIGSAIMHPIQTVKNIAGIGSGAVESLGRGLGSALFQNLPDFMVPERKMLEKMSFTGDISPEDYQSILEGTKMLQEEKYWQPVKQYAKDRYGSLDGFKKAVVKDPVGVLFDVTTLVSGGAGLVGKAATASKMTDLAKVAGTIEKVSTAINPAVVGTKIAGKTLVGAKNLAAKTTKFGVAQATGLSPKTISTIIEEPTAFSEKAMSTTTRAGLGETVMKGIQTELKKMSSLGEGYQAIRNLPKETTVSIPRTAVEEVLGKYGLQVTVKKGKNVIQTSKESIPMSQTDISGLQNFLDTYGMGESLTGNAFLNARTALSNLAKYDATKTNASTTLSRELRSTFDKLGKEQLPGLKELDIAYAPQTKLLKQIRKDYLNPDGTFKDGAASKLANLTGSGKEQVLGRLEQIRPGITKEINVLNAVEDIAYTKGQKVGAYARTALPAGAGLTLGGPVVGILAGVLGMIATSPAVVVPILRAYGSLNNIAKSTINAIIKKMVEGKPLSSLQKKIVIDALSSKEATKKVSNLKMNSDLATFKATPAEMKAMKANLPKVDPLIQEAKKYKSAEEFVRNSYNDELPLELPSDISKAVVKLSNRKEVPKNIRPQLEKIWNDLIIEKQVDITKLKAGEYGQNTQNLPNILENISKKKRNINHHIIVNKDGLILDGHHRVAQAIKNGDKTIKAKVVPWKGEFESALARFWRKSNNSF